MILTLKLVPIDNVKVNQHAKYPSQRSFSSNVIIRTDTHTLDRSLYLDHPSGR